jgi:hypothetical protein
MIADPAAALSAARLPPRAWAALMAARYARSRGFGVKAETISAIVGRMSPRSAARALAELRRAGIDPKNA